MISNTSAAAEDRAPHMRRVLQALNASRTPGWMFPAHFLGLFFEETAPDAATLVMPALAQVVSASHTASVAALGVLADVALAGAVRGQAGASVRLATLTLRLSFNRSPVGGTIRAQARQRLARSELPMPTAVSHLSMADSQGLFCSGEATFAILAGGRGGSDHPMPRRSTIETLPPLALDDLTGAERDTLQRARLAAHRAGAEGVDFLHAFWDLVPALDGVHARCRMHAGLHVSNRVGHFQGGVLLGLVARTSAALAPAGWHLLDLTAQYLEAGTGDWVEAIASPLRLGGSMASIECRVCDENGRLKMCAQASFVRT